MKKSTKRIAAILIAIVMLIGCSVGIISASASPGYDSSVVKQMEEAMKKYEDKMDGTVYTNMATAYTAYVNLCKVYDRYYYGNDYKNVTENVYNNAISTLNTAVNNMNTVFTAYSANNPDPIDGSYTTATGQSNSLMTNATLTNSSGSSGSGTWNNVSDELSGVLLTVGVGNETAYTNGQIGSDGSGLTGTGAHFAIQYGQVVFLYDGSTTLAVPVSMMYGRNGRGGTWRPATVYALDDQPVELRHLWHCGATGSGTSGNISAASSPGYHPEYTETLNYTTTGDYPAAGHSNQGNVYLSNTMYYKTSNLNFSDYLITSSSVTWKFVYNGSNGSADVNHGSNAISDGNLGAPTIYVLDYKSLIDAINNVASKYLTDIKSYREGGLTAIMTALDSATSYDPNKDFESISKSNVAASLSTAVTAAQTNIKTKVKDLQVTPTADTYGKLREAIDKARDKYFENDTATAKGTGGTNPVDSLGNPKYCTDAWDTFVAAYAKVADVQKNTSAVMQVDGKSGNYNNANVDTLAQELQNALAKVTEHKQGDTTSYEVPADNPKYYKAKCEVDGLGREISTCPNCSKTYLVADEVTLDAPDHTYVRTEGTGLSCTQNGTPAYYTCVADATETYEGGCGNYFADNNGEPGEKLDAQPGEVTATGHVFVLYQEKTEANCLHSGYYKNIYACTKCNKFFFDNSDVMSEDPENEVSLTALADNFIPQTEHNFGDKVNEVPSNCKSEGHPAYYYCGTCYHYFSAEDNAEDREDLGLTEPVTAKLPHEFNDPGAEHTYVTPTCRTAGSRIYFECDNCHQNFATTGDSEPLDETSIEPTYYHILIYHSAREATCLQVGYDEYYECALCGNVFDSNEQGKEDEADAASLVAFDKAHKKAESVDNLSEWTEGYKGLGSHNIMQFGASVATCMAPGEGMHYECVTCNKWFTDSDGSEETEEEITQDIDPNNHIGVWEEHTAQDASCTQEGWSQDVSKCLGCGRYYSAHEDDNTTTEEELLGTSLDDLTGIYIPEEAHNTDGQRDWVTVIDATCYSLGAQYRQLYCTNCGQDQAGATESGTIPMIAHTPTTDQPIESDSTCNQKGLKAHYVCDVCGKYLDESKTAVDLAALEKELAGHDYGDQSTWTSVVVPATCTTNAYVEGTCKWCGTESTAVERTDGEYKMTGHTFTDHKQKDATCLGEGIPATYYTCSVCNTNYTEDGYSKDGIYTTEVYTDNVTTPALGHDFVLGEVGTPGTCEAAGTVTYYVCNRDDCTLKDAKFVDITNTMATEGASESELTTQKDPTNHTSIDYVPAKAASCNPWEAGYVAHKYCEGCQHYYMLSDTWNEDPVDEYYTEKIEIPASHTLTHYDEYKSCLEEGWVEVWVCDDCGEFFTADTPTIQYSGLTEEDVIIEAQGHNFGEYVPAVDGTCVTPAKAGYVECTDCGIKVICEESEVNTDKVLFYEGNDSDKIEGEIDPNNHVNVVPVEGTDPKCGVPGVKDHFKCSDCGKEFLDEDCTEEATAENLKIDALEHSFTDYKSNNDATCTEDGTETAECDNGCGATDTRTIEGSAKGHELGEEIVSPLTDGDCQTKGTEMHYYVCKNCMVLYDREEVETELGDHNYESAITSEATCTKDGLTTYTCSICDDSYTEVIPATGHVLGDENSLVLTEAEDGGYDVVLPCPVCGAIIASTHVAAAASDNTETTTAASTETTTAASTETTTAASTETTTAATTEATTEASNVKANTSSKSPKTGLAIAIPVFSLAAMAGGFFSLGYAGKKKDEE